MAIRALVIDLELLLRKEGATLVSDLKGQVPVASGKLKESIAHEVNVNGAVLSLEIEAAEQLGWIERGRKKGKMPPVAAIRAWTILKGIDPRAAFPIALAIKRNGIAPRPFIKNMIATSEAGIRQRIERAFGEAMKIESMNLIKRVFPDAKSA